MNQLILVGRLTKDPELNVVEDEKKVSSVTLAVQRPFKNIDGTYDTDFVRCILWNAVAEATVEYCHKGDCIGVKGRIQSVSYEDEEKNKKTYLEVIADRVMFIGSNKSN